MNIFRGGIEYELIYSLQSMKLRNKNCKPRTIQSLRTNRHFYFLNILQMLIKQPGSLLCLQLVRSDTRLDITAIQIICIIQELS